MTSEARANPVNRGASMVMEQERAVHNLLQSLKGFSPKSLMMPIAIMFLIAFFVAPKGWVLGAIDHEIEQFQVHGELQNLDTMTIEKKLSTWLGSSFLTADLEEIKADVEALAWVHKATVTRVWPGQIELSLIEQKPVAYWNQGAFLNGEGDVFSPESVSPNHALPFLSGPESSELMLRNEMLNEMAHLKALLAPYGLDTNNLEVNERGSWSMTLNNGIHVALGSRPFDSKVERLATVLNTASDNKKQNMESIDTRYPNGVAVKWKEVTLASREK